MSKIILIGCGKSKRAVRSVAANLYTGVLFRARLAYAEASGVPWWIISAKYGLLAAYEVVDPYDLSLADVPLLDRVAWSLDVVHGIIDRLPDSIDTARELRQVHVEIHAGADYAEPLRLVAEAAYKNCRATHAMAS